jgi:hypothetical protein
MSAHNSNIFIEEINRARIVRFSEHVNIDIKVLRAILILSGANDCAHVSVSEHLNIEWIDES